MLQHNSWHQKKVLAIGDSLALPRENLNYEKTWIYKLKSNFQFDFVTLFQRAITTEVLVNWGGNGKNITKGADCLEFYKPDIIILQLGIVDCAPRLFPTGSLEKKIVSILPPAIRNNYIAFVKKTRKRKENKVDVPIEKFKHNVITYIERCIKCEVKKIIVIGICYPGKEMTSINPLIGKNVDKYNTIYQKIEKEYPIVSLINPLDGRKSDKKIFIDGYHPNELGHFSVYESLNRELNIE